MAHSSSNQESNRSSFPTFLDHDPYSSATHDGRPTSAGSVTTDGASEFGGGPDGDRFTASHYNSLTATGPVGEPALPPSRPTTGATTSSAARGNKMGMPPGSRRAQEGGPVNTTNPPSDKVEPKPSIPMSKSHVPSIVPQGFFRPMSSQRLQAQRGQHVSSTPTQPLATQNDSSRPVTGQGSLHSRAYSNTSLTTTRGGRPPTQGGDAPPLPSSRGTLSSQDAFFTPADGFASASVQSRGSSTPFRGRLDRLDIEAANNNLRAGVSPSDRTPRSPMSLRASLGLGSRTSRQEQERRPVGQHEKLESHPSSPRDLEKPVSAAHLMKSSKNTGKNYEYFAGNMLFFLRGRCMTTKAWPLSVATFVLTSLPAALFLAFSGPWLWHNVSPAIPIVFAYVFLVAMLAFLHAAFSDPGILPRNLHPHPPNPEEERDPLTVGPPNTEWVMVKTFTSGDRAPHPGRDASGESGITPGPTTAMEVPTKYCKTCNIWRPLRAHHCRVCDVCVDTQDHHCVWLNNCVGRRNYRYFFTYIGLAALLSLMLIAFSMTHVALYAIKHHISFGASLTGRTNERVGFAMFIYGVLSFGYPGSLFVYHVFLVSRGETTREYLNGHKFPVKDRHRPFTQTSSARNFISVLNRPRLPSFLQFKHNHEEGDVRFGHDVRKKDRRRDLKNRYSTPGLKNESNGGLEMDKLPPTASSGVSGQQASQMQQRPTARSASGLSGPINSTPRL